MKSAKFCTDGGGIFCHVSEIRVLKAFASFTPTTPSELLTVTIHWMLTDRSRLPLSSAGA